MGLASSTYQPVSRSGLDIVSMNRVQCVLTLGHDVDTGVSSLEKDRIANTHVLRRRLLYYEVKPHSLSMMSVWILPISKFKSSDHKSVMDPRAYGHN